MPVSVSSSEAAQANSIADIATNVLKDSAVDEQAAVVAPKIVGFDSVPPTDIAGVRSIVNAVGIGVVTQLGTSQADPKSFVKRDANGDFSTREITVDKIIFSDETFMIAAATGNGGGGGFTNGTQALIYFVAFDDVTGARKTGLAPTVKVSKDGGALVAATSTPGEVGDGIYSLVLTAAEMTADVVFVDIQAADAVVDQIELRTS